MALRRDKTDENGELVIDAEVAELPEQTGDGPRAILPARRGSLPEATQLRAIEARKEADIAVRNVAVATAGGVVAGAATVVIARVAQKLARPAPGLARRRRKDVLASRSFMVDVHMLKQR